jgi:Smg protein
MKENILDVLLYLFENFVYDDPDSLNDRDSLQASLLEAGFSPSEINKAFEWLDALARERPQLCRVQGTVATPLRVYAREEIAKLDTEGLGFLMFLEHSGVLDAERRELVLDRIMALDADEVDLDDLKWVILMVLFSQPGQEAACAFLENDLLEGAGEALN